VKGKGKKVREKEKREWERERERWGFEQRTRRSVILYLSLPTF